jgi:hypothetical protein
MFGAGILLRVIGKSGINLFDRLGVFPPRWFLVQALGALSEDDLPMAIRFLERVRGRNSHRWELIRQQAVFRCRLLKESHKLSIERLERIKDSGLLPEKSRGDLQKVLNLHSLAIQLLSGYESKLLALSSLKRPNPNRHPKGRSDALSINSEWPAGNL